jgi:nucleoid-associated protein YgaU
VTAKVEYCVIQSGDTLSALAKKYYGNAMEYNKIFVGQKIRNPLS